MTIEKEILSLCAHYYSLIGNDHHKDRDCHFFVETKFSSYKDTPTYSISHYGYINDFEGIEAESYQMALAMLRVKLKELIADEIYHTEKVLRAPEDYDYHCASRETVDKIKLEVFGD